MSTFGSIIQVFRPYFFPNQLEDAESKFAYVFQIEDYGIKWGSSSTENVSIEGFGPISTQREVDFTVEFENSVLLLLPNLLLLALVVISAIRKGFLLKRYNMVEASPTDRKLREDRGAVNDAISANNFITESSDSDINVFLPTENQLLRYRSLLVLKAATSALCAGSFVAAAGVSALSNAGGSNVFGFCVCAVGMLVALYSSQRQHRSTWQPSLTLQIYAIMMVFVLSIRLRTEWTRQDKTNNALAIILSSTLLLLVLWTILESIPRMTSARRQQLDLAPDLTANVFSLLTFQYVQPLLSKGYRLHRKGSDLDVELLFPLRPDRISKILGFQFVNEWHRQTRKRGSGNIWVAFLRLYAPTTIVPVGLYLLYTAAQYASPLLLNGFLSWLATFGTDIPGPIRLGIEYAFGMFGISVLLSIFFGVSIFYVNQEVMSFRGAVISAIYQKALRLSPEEFSKRSIGDISNHISVDAESLVDGELALMAICGLPLSIALGLYFMYLQLSWAIFPGLAWFILVCFGLQSRLGKQFGDAMKYRLKNMDIRVSLVNESLSGIKFVKFNAWEKPFMESIMEPRAKELEGLVMRGKAFLKMITTTQLSKNCTPVIMFWVYVMAVASPTEPLNANRIFVSSVIINMISANIELLSFSLSWIYTVIASMKRIQTFLNADELARKDVEHKEPSNQVSEKAPIKEGAIVFTDAQYTWTRSVSEAKFKLEVPSLAIEEKEFLAVVGRIGSGKSSFLSAILGNMYCQKGGFYMDRIPVAYCSQSPFILNATLEDNILFGQVYDKTALDECIAACALEPDIALLPGGSKTEIGERGIGLSGGQKARVALARACYAVKIGYASAVILDDVLSAVDVHTEKHLFKHVLSSETGLLRWKTRILVTHAVHYMSNVDRILYLSEGAASQIGTHDELMASEGLYRSLINEFGKPKRTGSVETKEQDQEFVASGSQPAERKEDKDNGALTAEEEMKTGRVTWKVYARFIVSGGLLNFFIAAVILLSHRVVYYVGYFWLSNWINMENPSHSSSFYLGIYTLFQLLAMITQPLGYYIGLVYFGIRASKTLFERMLNRVFRAPMSFFDTTPTGRLLNRFGSDMNELDAGLTDKLFVTLGQFNQVVVSLVAAGIATPYLFAVVPVLTVVYYYIMAYYQATTRSLRRLDAGRTRSPLFQHITHTLEGMHTIKAYGLTEEWLKEFHSRVDLNQRSKRMEIILMGWMNVRLELLGAILILGSAAFAVIARYTISPSLAGLGVSTLMNVVTFLSVVVTTVSQMEVCAVHAERVLEYTELPSEAPLDLPKDDEYKEWPTNGTIKFKNFSARYRKGLPLSLHNVNVEFKGGSKVAVVGRTGSGKSTLTLALFRIIEGTSYTHQDSGSETTLQVASSSDMEKGAPELEDVGGSVIIDGVNIAELGLAKLRSAIAIIPQDATMFGGTLRTNLSPFGKHSDDQLWNALDASGLKKHVKQNMLGGLDAKILPGGTNLSKGQLQQVGLARAMLRKAQILVLDEATSSMDLETDAVIQKAIRSHFSSCTVITIAHRIATILDSDAVLVMEAGTVAEYGSPKALLENPSSLFTKLALETSQRHE